MSVTLYDAEFGRPEGAVIGPRFAMLPESVLYSNVSDKAVRLYAVLSRHANARNAAFPGRKLLAEELGASSLRTVDTAMAELVTNGFVCRSSRFRSDGTQTSSDVFLCAPFCTPSEPSTREDAAAEVQNPAGYRANSCTVPVQNPAPQLTRAIEREKTRAVPAPDALRGFSEFWSAYPTRNGKRLGRGLCEKRWKAMALEAKRAAWRGARNYALAVGDGLTIAKDPDRWLRDKCWEDWQEPATSSKLSAPAYVEQPSGYDSVTGLPIYGDPAPLSPPQAR